MKKRSKSKKKDVKLIGSGYLFRFLSDHLDEIKHYLSIGYKTKDIVRMLNIKIKYNKTIRKKYKFRDDYGRYVKTFLLEVFLYRIGLLDGLKLSNNMVSEESVNSKVLDDTVLDETVTEKSDDRRRKFLREL